MKAEEEETYTAPPFSRRGRFHCCLPQVLGDPPHWNLETDIDNPDFPFVRVLIEKLGQHCAIDLKRVYATGMSNGGGMTSRVGCKLSKYIAAIAPVAGIYPYLNVCSLDHPMPVISFHGTSDEQAFYEGSGAPESLNQTVGAWPPIPYWAATWAMYDLCASRPEIFYRKANIFGERWSSCKNDVEVILFTIEGGEHIWPGTGMNPRQAGGFTGYTHNLGLL